MRIGWVIKTVAGLGLVWLGFAWAGCGVLATQRTSFPNQAETPSGRPIYVEDVERIVDDTQLSADEQREALRELGIEDEDLIESLLTLP